MQLALPPREARAVERVALGCAALALALVTYGILQTMLASLRGPTLWSLDLPGALLVLLAGAPVVLDAALLGTGALPRGRRLRMAAALLLLGVALAMAPMTFFHALPLALQEPLVFHALVETALVLVFVALWLAAPPRVDSWSLIALALAISHAVVVVRVGELAAAGSGLGRGWIAARDGTLLLALAILAWAYAGEASKSRPA